MQSTVVATGRRILLALEPGDEVLSSIGAACLSHGVRQGVIVTFSGALRTAEIIASDSAPLDPELPMPDATLVSYTEGIGSGTVTEGPEGPVVHVHVALGLKDDSGRAVAGHLLRARTHYVVEVVIDEVLSPTLRRAPHPGSSGIPILTFDPES